MNSIDFLPIGHGQQSDARMMAEINVTDSQRVELAAVHRHLFYAVYWVHEGQGTHSIDFCDYEIQSNRVFIVRPEQVHVMRPKGVMRYSALQFTEEYFHLYAKITDAKLPAYIDLADETVRQRLQVLLQQIVEENSNERFCKMNMLQGEVFLFMTELSRCTGAWHNEQPLPEVLTQYRQLIERHFSEKHQVAEYASQLGLSPNYLNVLCRKHLGLSALRMIDRRIVLEIKRLLMENEKTISQIAYSLGFYELSYLSRFFRRMEGVSPAEFREHFTFSGKSQ